MAIIQIKVIAQPPFPPNIAAIIPGLPKMVPNHVGIPL